MSLSVNINFEATPLTGKPPLAVAFTNLTTVSSGYSVEGWLWNFGDGNTSTEEHPVHTYIQDGFHTVSLRVRVDL